MSIELLTLLFSILVSFVSAIGTMLWFLHVYDKARTLEAVEIKHQIIELKNKVSNIENRSQDVTELIEIKENIKIVDGKTTRQTKLFFRLVEYINIDLREQINQLTVNSGSYNLLKTFKGDRISDQDE